MVTEVANNRVSTSDLTGYSFNKAVGQFGFREEDFFFPYEITLCVDVKDFCIFNAVSNDVKCFKIKNK